MSEYILFRNEKGTGAKMCPSIIVSGIITMIDQFFPCTSSESQKSSRNLTWACFIHIFKVANIKRTNECLNEWMNEWITNEVMTCLLFFTTYSPIFLHHVIIHGIPSFDARDGKNLKYFNCFMWLVQVSRLFSQILPFTLIKMFFFPVSYPFSITIFLNLKLVFGKNKKPVVNFALFHNV